MKKKELQKLSLDWDQLNSLFSVVLVLDDSLQILHTSETLDHFVSDPMVGRLLTDVFEFSRPFGVTGSSDLDAAGDSLFLLIAKTGEFAIRGQVKRLLLPDATCYCFLGAPWLAWMEANIPETRLKMGDFAKQDSQLDQLFYISSEKQMVDDLEKLTLELRDARDVAEQVSKEKSDFFAVMSHEMRTPLNGVINSLGMMEREPPTSLNNSTLIEIADASARNLLSVVNYVLDYSKIESGQFELESSDFDIRRLIGSVTDILRSKAQSGKVSVSEEIAGDFPCLLSGDDAKIRQVLINLVGNAIKFSPGGGVRLRAEKIGVGQETTRVRFAVSDNGIGIPQDKRDKIFEAFYSSDRGRKDIERGTGLGLDICRRLVSAMGGQIGLESAPGQGATFWFEVELGVTGRPCDADDSNLNTAAPGHWFSGRVLLVDDNLTNLMLGQMMLERFGVDVDVAASGEDAVNMINQSHYDMVFMDITMPGMDGIETTAIIQHKPKFKDLPIIALTAHVSADARKKYLDSGMRGYLSKPLDNQELADTLEEYLGDEITDSRDTTVEELSTPANKKQGHVGASAQNGYFDRTQADKLIRELNAETFINVANIYLTESKAVAAEITAAYAANNMEDVASKAHSIRSSSDSVGLVKLGHLLKKVELTARSGEIDSTGKLMEGLELAMERSFEDLSSFIDGLVVR